MKIYVIIPSRYGSTRFEGKPLANICGKPMIRMVCERVGQAACVTDVAVATDDPRIKEAVLSFGGKVVMTSDKNRTGTDRVCEAADILGLCDDDIIVNVQGDQPLIHPKSVEEVAAPLIASPDIPISTLGFKIVNRDEITNPKDVKVTFDKKGFALYFSRSPIPFGRDPETRFDTYKHLGIYAYTKRFLKKFSSLPMGELEGIEKLEQLRALEFGYKIMVKVTEHDSPEVDLPGDIQRIESLLR